jgi:S-DNA-T family DNA segregation ATPase FtsK/SpoIIIE
MADRCEECGFEAGSLAPADTVAALRALPRRYRAPLTRFLPGEDGDAVLRRKPDPSTWSALEYACHVRDVFAVYAERLERTLAEETPELESMRRDGRAVRDRYNEQQPAPVADQLTKNAEHLAAQLEHLTEADWERTAILSYPEPAPRTVLWMARRVAHEGNHHLLDIGRVLRTVRAR